MTAMLGPIDSTPGSLVLGVSSIEPDSHWDQGRRGRRRPGADPSGKKEDRNDLEKGEGPVKGKAKAIGWEAKRNALEKEKKKKHNVTHTRINYGSAPVKVRRGDSVVIAVAQWSALCGQKIVTSESTASCGATRLRRTVGQVHGKKRGWATKLWDDDIARMLRSSDVMPAQKSVADYEVSRSPIMFHEYTVVDSQANDYNQRKGLELEDSSVA
ncbi:hypothetical protein EDB92DRAFT_1818649 [Lactarius akahatsu]|uniref:Uncharacterized protein n=1 Tax=Lactarius akahatsu TaxID=416441 RepID=A0AAD4LC44_9AGAM|nr:hypothetical protein EDB92DRAFT_1818649 [Lactarius akahatsu]